MGFLNSLKKKLKDELSSASDFTLKKSDDSFDFVKHIASSTARNPTKNLGNVLSGLNYGADTLTGAVTSPFYDYKKDQTTGQIKSNFDLKRGLGIYGKEIGTLGMSDALQNDYGLKARQLGRERDGSFLGDIKLAHSFGQQFAGAEDTPAGVRTGLNIALDPTNIIGGGTIGRTGSALEKFGVPGTKLLLGARGAGATSRTARIAGGLVEGMGKYTIPAAVGSGIGAQISSMTPWKGDDQIAPFAGAVLGAGLTHKAEAGVQLRKSAIDDTEFERRMTELRKQSMSSDSEVARAAEDAMNQLGDLRSRGMIQPSKKIPRGPKLDELTDEELNAINPDTARSAENDVLIQYTNQKYPGLLAEDDNSMPDPRVMDGFLPKGNIRRNSKTGMIDDEDFVKSYQARKEFFDSRKDLYIDPEHPDSSQLISSDQWAFEKIRRASRDIMANLLRMDNKEILAIQADGGDYGQQLAAINVKEPLGKYILDQFFMPDENPAYPKGIRFKLRPMNAATKESFPRQIAMAMEEYGKTFKSEADRANRFSDYLKSVTTRKEAEGGRGFFGSAMVEQAGGTPESSRLIAEGIAKNKAALEALDKGDKKKALQLFAESRAAHDKAIEIINKNHPGLGVQDMNEWDKIRQNQIQNPEGSMQGPPPFEGDTKFMTQEEKAAQSNLVRQQMGDSAAKAAAEAKLIGTDTPIEPKSNGLFQMIRDALNKRESIQPMGVGLEAPTVRDHLQEMIWGDNSGLSKSTTRFESARESYIKKGNEFKKPDLPLGDVRQRAEEMLNQLPDDILNMRITNFTAAKDIPWMLNEFDKENMARIKDVELQAYRSQFSNKPATINYNTPLGTAGSQATTAASEVARHEFPEVTMYHGTSGDFEGELKPGSFVTPNRQDAVRYAEADARLTGGQPRVIELRVRQDGMMPPADQGIASARGAMQITDPALAKRVIPLEEADNSVVTAAEAMDNIQARLTGGQPLGNSNMTVTVLNPDEIRKDLKYLSDMRPMGQIADNVKNIKSNPLTRFIMGTLQVNPSALMHTPIGRLVVAERRQRLAIEEYTNNAMALLDKHMPSLGLGGINRVMNMDDKGVVKNVGKHWNDVIAEAKSTDFKGLESEQIAFIKSFNDIIDDLKALRLANAIDAMPTEINGRMWVPREVSGIRGTEIEKPTNHNLDRIWELATDAVKNGVKYDDPRETLKLYIYDTYNEIVKRQFADEMIKITDPTESLVSPKYRQTLEQRKAVFDSEKANLKQAVEQYQKDKANPDFKAILEKQKGITKAANSEMRKAQKALELAIKDAKDQESNKQIRYNLDGTTSPVAALRINKAGERVMSRPDAELIRKYIGVGGSPTIDQEESFVAKAFGAAGRGIRVTTSTFDFAAPFTHNLPMLFTNPIGWSKAAAGQYRSYIDPKFKAQYISENLATINEMSKYNVQVGANEYYEAVNPNRGIFGSNYGKGVKQQTIGRFQNAMDTALTIARVEAWKANRDWITDGGTKNFDGLAQYVRNMTGALDSRSLMLSKGQRDFESFWLAFSPRLFRSTVALAGMAMKPTTKQGAAALRSLAVITAGSSAMFYLGNLAAGNSEEDARNSINPLSGRKYLSVKTPYGYIGIGGQVRAASQFIADAGQAMVTGNMSDFTTWDQNQNPILRWYTGRGAPAIGMLQNTIEATTGANANPYAEINGFPDLLVQTGKDFMPFVAQNILEGEDFKQALATGKFSKIWGTDAVLSAVGAFGPRTTPFTRGEETNQRVKAMGFTTLDGKPIDSFKDLNKEQKDQYYERFPVERVKGNDNVTKMFNLIDEANTEFDTDVNNMAANVQMGKMTKLQFREWYQTRQKDKFSRINQIKADFSVMDANRPGFKGSVTDYIASKNVTAEDKAVDAFYAISGNTPLLADGTVDFDGIDAKKKALLQSLTPAQRAYVERMTNKPSQTPDNKMVSEYDIVKDITKPYWEANGAVFDAVKASSGFLSQFANYDAYQNWIAATSQEYGLTPDTVGAFIESKIPDVKKFNEVMSNYKKAMRLTNPYLDRALTEWYGMEPANRLDFVLSGYGSDAGVSAAGAIYNGSDVGSRKNSTQLALALKAKQLRQVPRDYSQYQYRLSKN